MIAPLDGVGAVKTIVMPDAVHDELAVSILGRPTNGGPTWSALVLGTESWEA